MYRELASPVVCYRGQVRVDAIFKLYLLARSKSAGGVHPLKPPILSLPIYFIIASRKIKRKAKLVLFQCGNVLMPLDIV